MASGRQREPFPVHKSGRIEHAASLQRAIYDTSSPSLRGLRTREPERTLYSGRLYRENEASPSYYSERQQGREHYYGCECDYYYGHERGRGQGRQTGWRVYRRSSRSQSPFSHEAIEKNSTYFGSNNPYGEGCNFRGYGPTKPRYEDDDDNDEEDAWEDVLEILDSIEGANHSNGHGKAKLVEYEYLKRMLTKLRRRRKSLLPQRIRRQLSRDRSYFNSRGEGHGNYPQRYRFGRRPRSRTSSPARAPRQFRSRSRSRSRPMYRDVRGMRDFRRNRDYSRFTDRSSRRTFRRDSYDNRALSRHGHSDAYGPRRAGEHSSGPYDRQARPTGQSKNHGISQTGHISSELRPAIQTRAYPARTYGQALHIQRWLSDRYTTQTSFDFGNLPRSEGVKESYVQDPDDPDKYYNVPRPSQRVPGARGDYYRGAAWNHYQQEKQEWLEQQGCHYPDIWTNPDAFNASNDGDVTMSGSEEGDAASAASYVSEAGSNKTIKAPQENKGISFFDRQQTPNDQTDTISDYSDQDLILFEPGEWASTSDIGNEDWILDLDEPANDNGALLPQVYQDPQVDYISTRIEQTIIGGRNTGGTDNLELGETCNIPPLIPSRLGDEDLISFESHNDNGALMSPVRQIHEPESTNRQTNATAYYTTSTGPAESQMCSIPALLPAPAAFKQQASTSTIMTASEALNVSPKSTVSNSPQLQTPVTIPANPPSAPPPASQPQPPIPNFPVSQPAQTSSTHDTSMSRYMLDDYFAEIERVLNGFY